MPNKEIKPLKKELLSQEKSHSLALSAFKAFEPLLKPEFSDYTVTNLSALNDALKNTSVIGVGYHPGKIEALAIPMILRSQLPDMKRLIGPIAAYQHHKLSTQAWEFVAASMLTTHFLPTVRNNNLDDKPYKKHREKYGSRLMYHTKNELSGYGSIYGVIPGATRSKILQDPDQLNTSFVRGGINPRGSVPYVAIAGYMHKEKFHIGISKLLHLPDFPKVIGSSIEKAQQNAAWIMRHLAGLLHPELQGSYKPIYG